MRPASRFRQKQVLGPVRSLSQQVGDQGLSWGETKRLREGHMCPERGEQGLRERGQRHRERGQGPREEDKDPRREHQNRWGAENQESEDRDPEGPGPPVGSGTCLGRISQATDQGGDERNVGGGHRLLRLQKGPWGRGPRTVKDSPRREIAHYPHLPQDPVGAMPMNSVVCI